MKLAVALIFLATSAAAHDQWVNGDPVPPWVKQACCGPDDAHHLFPDQVHSTPSGWKIDGFHGTVPNGEELFSPDGTYWIFYRTFSDGSQTQAYCFFIPEPGV